MTPKKKKVVKEKFKGANWLIGYQYGRYEILKVVEGLIVEEILIARKEGQRTSRLTSLAMKLKSLNNL